jgi:hypothetical protein
MTGVGQPPGRERLQGAEKIQSASALVSSCRSPRLASTFSKSYYRIVSLALLSKNPWLRGGNRPHAVNEAPIQEAAKRCSRASHGAGKISKSIQTHSQCPYEVLVGPSCVGFQLWKVSSLLQGTLKYHVQLIVFQPKTLQTSNIQNLSI